MVVNAWTVDDPDEMARLAGWGVDGIVTNVPDVALEVLGPRASGRLPAEEAPGQAAEAAARPAAPPGLVFWPDWFMVARSNSFGWTTTQPWPWKPIWMASPLPRPIRLLT